MLAHPETPRIYVACLASYNNGVLHGAWIDCDQSADDIHEDIASMLAQSREPLAEEWAIHDYENFGPLSIGEYDDIDEIAERAALIEEHGEAYAAFVDHTGETDESAFLDHYHGEWDSETAYAEHVIDECYDIERTMGALACYFDYERFARDLFCGDHFSVDSSSGVYVFSH